jgi:hypothetical protein
VRVRPFDDKEVSTIDTINVNQNNISITDLKQDSRHFSYDFVLDKKTSQSQLFNTVGK